jgi:tetratricopeptide (TPR) repeat protein
MLRFLSIVSFMVWLSVPHAAAAQAKNPAPSPQPDAAAQEIAALSRERQNTNEQLEKVDKQVGHLEQELVLMLAILTLGGAFFVGSVIVGEYRVRQAVRELKSDAKEAKQKFPMLAGMEKQARHALEELEVMFGAEEWLEDRYARLEIVRRQRILTVEHLIALEFTGPATAPQLRGMANFYSSKYTAEKLPSDLDRALYYALLASERGKGRFQYLNDLGLIYLDLGDRNPDFLKEAKESFLQSKQKNPDQQRCYYNLGTMYVNEAVAELKQGRKEPAKTLLNKACEELITTLSYENWESGPSPELTSVVRYNLACCLCRLAEDAAPPQGQSDRLDEVVSYLQSVSKYKQTKPATLYDDLDLADGDLHTLQCNRFYEPAVKAIRAAFEKTWNG